MLCSVLFNDSGLDETMLPLLALSVNPLAGFGYSFPGNDNRCSQQHIQVKQLDSFRHILPQALFAFTMLWLSGTIVANLLACLLKSNYQHLISVLGKFPSYMISTEALSQLNVIVFAELAQPWSWKLASSHTHDKTTDCLVRRPTKNNAASCNNLHHPSGLFQNDMPFSPMIWNYCLLAKSENQRWHVGGAIGHIEAGSVFSWAHHAT